MTAPAVFAILSAWLPGLLGVAALWPGDRSLRRDAMVILSLGLGLGLGVTSAMFYLASLVSDTPLLTAAAIEWTLAAGLAIAVWRRWRRRRPAAEAGSSAGGFLAFAILGTLFLQAGLVAGVVAVRAYQSEPYSNSDGWTIWLMQARFLFRGGGDWPAVLQAPQISWVHPDYPLLVPASFARAWAFAGQDAPVISGTISALFGLATLGLLVGTILTLRDRLIAIAGGLLLLGTPFFVTFSSNQHADIPLGFYILAALAAVALAGGQPRDWRLPALAGFAAGMAAWTKNEGLLFVVVFSGAWVLHEGMHRRWGPVAAFAAGLAIALLPVAHFKLLLAPANDIMASRPWDRLADLVDPARHRLIVASLWRDVWRFGEWRVVPFGLMLLPLIGGGWRRIKTHEWLVALVLLLVLGGYYAVYLLTHWEVTAHLDSSLVRLLLQLWPAALLFWALAASTCPPRAGAAAGDRHRWRRLVLGSFVVNAVAGVLVFGAMNRQLAANQLAAANLKGGRVTVLIGDGWYGRESHGRDVWVWSQGESALLLNLDGTQPCTTSLSFTLRGLGDRTVTATVDNRVVWRGRVGEEPQAVEIAGLALLPGITRILLQDDAPGVAESPAGDARALTFAVYNPRFH
jgi:hypothetical protein